MKSLTEGELWSFVRSVMSHGATIHQDYVAGKHKTYEHYSARMDAASAERCEEILARLPQEEGMTIAGNGAAELGKLMREQRGTATSISAQRWTGLVQAHDNGGFVAVGDHMDAVTDVKRLTTALEGLLACHTESAMVTMSMAVDRAAFAEMVARSEARVEAAVVAAKTALRHNA